jgi:hypothetical protein
MWVHPVESVGSDVDHYQLADPAPCIQEKNKNNRFYLLIINNVYLSIYENIWL